MGFFCLAVVQAPVASLSPELTLQSCLGVALGCVVGPGWMMLGFNLAYLRMYTQGYLPPQSSSGCLCRV